MNEQSTSSRAAGVAERLLGFAGVLQIAKFVPSSQRHKTNFTIRTLNGVLGME
jgi:hypothetical protein